MALQDGSSHDHQQCNATLEAKLAQVVEALANADDKPRLPEEDRQIREDIAQLAAMMINNTAHHEGAASPIWAMLEQAKSDPLSPMSSDTQHTMPSLAERAKKLL